MPTTPSEQQLKLLQKTKKLSRSRPDKFELLNAEQQRAVRNAVLAHQNIDRYKKEHALAEALWRKWKRKAYQSHAWHIVRKKSKFWYRCNIDEDRYWRQPYNLLIRSGVDYYREYDPESLEGFEITIEDGMTIWGNYRSARQKHKNAWPIFEKYLKKVYDLEVRHCIMAEALGLKESSYRSMLTRQVSWFGEAKKRKLYRKPTEEQEEIDEHRTQN
jgi:NAD-dependent SIR2 family protein deacetylase